MICGLASAIVFLGASKSAQEIFIFKMIKRLFKTDTGKLCTWKRRLWVGKQYHIKEKLRKMLSELIHFLKIVCWWSSWKDMTDLFRPVFQFAKDLYSIQIKDTLCHYHRHHWIGVAVLLGFLFYFLLITGQYIFILQKF